MRNISLAKDWIQIKKIQNSNRIESRLMMHKLASVQPRQTGVRSRGQLKVLQVNNLIRWTSRSPEPRRGRVFSAKFHVDAVQPFDAAFIQHSLFPAGALAPFYVSPTPCQTVMAESGSSFTVSMVHKNKICT